MSTRAETSPVAGEAEGVEPEEPAPPSAPTRWELRIGAAVYARDGGLLGTLRRVVMDPGGQRVAGLIVRSGTLLGHDLLIPRTAVKDANEEAILLEWSLEEARQRGHFHEAHFHVPASRLAGYEAGQAVASLRGGAQGGTGGGEDAPGDLPQIAAGLRVEALDGMAGRAREVLAEASSSRVTHLVFHHSLLWAWDRLLPVHWVREVTQEAVAVEATLADLARLPVYRSDDELGIAIREAWERDPVARAGVNTGRPRPGRKVLDAEEQPIGHVYRAVVSPRSRLVTAVIVNAEAPEPGAPRSARRQRRNLGVPVEWIGRATEEEVRLRIPVVQVASARVFRPDEYVAPDPCWIPPAPFSHDDVLIELHRPDRPLAEYEAAPSAPVPIPTWTSEAACEDESRMLACSSPVIGRDDPVRARPGPIGRVDHVLRDPASGAAAYVVVRAGSGLAKDTLIPVDWIRRIYSDGVFVDAGPGMLAALPEYQPPLSDREIAGRILKAIQDRLHLPLPGLPYEVIVQVDGGKVTLRGRVRDERERGIVLALARDVPGVWFVADRLLTDAAIEARTSAALASHPWTRGVDLTPEIHEGDLILHGAEDEDARAAARAIHAEVTGAQEAES